MRASVDTQKCGGVEMKEHDAFFPWLFQFSNCILMEIAHTIQPPASQIRIICRIRLCIGRTTYGAHEFRCREPTNTASLQNRKRNKNSMHKLLTIAAIELFYTETYRFGQPFARSFVQLLTCFLTHEKLHSQTALPNDDWRFHTYYNAHTQMDVACISFSSKNPRTYSGRSHMYVECSKAETVCAEIKCGNWRLSTVCGA